ncbi:MAG: OmpA family protein [Pseudomonadota bacterium]
MFASLTETLANSPLMHASKRMSGAMFASVLAIASVAVPLNIAEAQSASKRMATSQQIFKSLSASPRMQRPAKQMQRNTRRKFQHQGQRRGQNRARRLSHRRAEQRFRQQRFNQHRRGGQQRMSLRQLKRNHQVRRSLPSINIQAINFAFGSSRISHSQRWKVEMIANAMHRFGGYERFMIEGHTDAVGSYAANQHLSERRALALKYALVDWFGVPARSLVTVGYGEEYLLVHTQWEDWRNRRVTLRRVTDVLR